MNSLLNQFEPAIAGSIVSSALDADFSGSYIVSSSAYVQSFDEECPDHVLFVLEQPESSAKAYVFCLFTGLSADDNRSDYDLWQFIVLPTSVGDDISAGRGFTTLPALTATSELCCYADLSDTFRAVVSS